MGEFIKARPVRAAAIGAVSGIAVLAAASRASAQQQGEPELPVPSGIHFLLDRISIFAQRGERQLLDIPATVTVIDHKEIEKRMVRDIEDLVRYEPGVSVARITSRTDPTSSLSGFTIRGVGGNRVLMMVDGTRMIERVTDGNRDFMDMSNLKAVEVIRGPGSVLWGSDALGGIVAFRTKDPDDYLKGTGKLFGGQADTSYDTFDQSWIKTITAAAQSDPRGTWQVLLSASQRDAHEPTLSKADPNGGIWGCPRNPEAIRCNELDPLDLRSQNVLGKIVFRPNDDHEFKLTGEWFNRDATVDQKYDLGFNSTATTGTSLGPSPNGSGIVHGYVRTAEQERWRITFSHDWQVHAPWLDSVRWQLNYSPQQRHFTGNRSYTRTTGATGLYDRHYLHHYQEEFTEGDLQLKSTLALPGQTHRFTYGYYGALTKTDYRRQDIYTNLTSGTVTEVRAGGFNFANADTTRSDFYIQDEISLLDDRLIVTPGIRYSTYDIDPRPNADYQVVPGAEPRRIKEDNLSKKIGAIYKFNENISMFGNYAEGFKMPTPEQLYTSLPGTFFNLVPNPDLRPESVKSYEIGVRGQFERGFISVSAFRSKYKDFIQSFYFIPNTSPQEITYENLSTVDIRGWEIFGEVQIAENWFLNAALTSQRGDQILEDGDPMTPFNGASPLTLVTGLRYDNPALGLTGELIGTFADGMTRVTPEDHFKPDGYAVFDTIWSWKLNPTWTLRAAVFNIFDKRYFKWPMANEYLLTPVQGQAISNPLELQTQPGRTYRVGLSVEF